MGGRAAWSAEFDLLHNRMNTTEAGTGLAAPLVTEWNGNLPAGPRNFVESIGGAVFDPGADTVVLGAPLAGAAGTPGQVHPHDADGDGRWGVAGASCSGRLFFMQIPELEAPATSVGRGLHRSGRERGLESRRAGLPSSHRTLSGATPWQGENAADGEDSVCSTGFSLLLDFLVAQPICYEVNKIAGRSLLTGEWPEHPAPVGCSSCKFRSWKLRPPPIRWSFSTTARAVGCEDGDAAGRSGQSRGDLLRLGRLDGGRGDRVGAGMIEGRPFPPEIPRAVIPIP